MAALISAFLLASLLASSTFSPLAQAQESTQTPFVPLNQENVGPNYSEQAPQDKAVWPMVDVDRQQNKSTVDVHVPIFFDMTNHKDAESGRSKLDLSVLQGLVTVNKDRVPDQNGRMNGPLKVTVFGIPVYQGRAPTQELDGQTRSSLTDRAQQTTDRIQTTVRQNNEKLLTGLSDFLGRLNSMVRQASQAVAGPITSGSYQQAPIRVDERQQPLQPISLSNSNSDQQPQSAALSGRLESNQIERMPIRSAREELFKP